MKRPATSTFPSPPVSTPAELLERFAAWQTNREAIAAREDSGDYPPASDWEGSDDEAVDLLKQMAAALAALAETSTQAPPDAGADRYDAIAGAGT